MAKNERFEEKVERTGSCWLWVGMRNADGYGIVRVGGKLLRAHRRSYELYLGEIPSGMLVLHRCDNPPCVNPDHLFIGNALHNAQDRDMKKRGHISNWSKRALWT